MVPSEEHEPPKLIPQAPARARAVIPLPGPTLWDKGRVGLGLNHQSGCVVAARACVAPQHPLGPAAVARSAGWGRCRAMRPAVPAPVLSLQRLERPGGPRAKQAPVEGAARSLASQSHKELRETKGESWPQTRAAC